MESGPQETEAYQDHSDHFYEPRNGIFLGHVELIAQFGPVMNEHLKRINNKQCKQHFLNTQTQNELIKLATQKTTDAIVDQISRAKYCAFIMDCTRDKGHTEQLSIVMHIVNCEIGFIVPISWVLLMSRHNWKNTL